MTTEQIKPRHEAAAAMKHMMETSGWRQLESFWRSQMEIKHKKLLDLTKPIEDRDQAVIEYSTIRQMLEMPYNIIREKDLNDGR